MDFKRGFCAAIFVWRIGSVLSLSLESGGPLVVFYNDDGAGSISVVRDNQTILRGLLGVGLNLTSVNCIGMTHCRMGDISVNVTMITDGIEIAWETENTDLEFSDCFELNTTETHWYGGPERKVQRWPLEKQTIDGSEAYVLKATDNFAVAERYWLNSDGLYFFVDERVPLFVDQNNNRENTVCFNARVENPYINRTRNFLRYTFIVKENPKEAHLHAVKNYLGMPKGYPNEKMIKEPIWTTWAKYKRLINDSVVLDFAQEIRDHGFQAGQLEIDDAWEKCYGAQEFNSDTFANISDTVSKLKEMAFRVTLWVHPFVDSDCQDNSKIGIEKGYFVGNPSGNINGTWWNSNNTHQIDFTNSEASDWYSARLKKLQTNPGIDNFKFDAGETNYSPEPSVYAEVDQELVPNVLSEKYVRTCAEFGSLVEVRSAWRTQDLPVFVRMIDKDSNWGEENGLYTLITTLLQMNTNGYTIVLPDMIGGNGYSGMLPSAELLVRWTQANIFMPAMQFSYLPWEIVSDEFDTLQIVKDSVALHEKYSDEIMKAMNNSVINGTPVNPSIWWADPTDPIALACDDEFLLGENILVAPVIVEGARSRQIYIPKGHWKDGNSGIIYVGPITLSNYSAPINILPYFIKQ
ncbi:hypothetical protein NQ318_002871 [Aromia moschata]|uniref:Uncharacterized protein n=1 Tax=Aromia moschata TaxID=1265417 RepID=A0AAV8Y8M5_9CUCU|nr:hypothetical protein NQ318_002871 [Aromia moschata]